MFGLHKGMFGLHRDMFGIYKVMFGQLKAMFGLHTVMSLLLIDILECGRVVSV